MSKLSIVIIRGIFCFLLFLLVMPGYGQSGLIQHLDAGIAGSIVIDGSGAVETWQDQSGASNDAVQDAGSVFIVQEDDLNWLDFGSGRNMLQLFSAAGSDSWLDQSSATDGFCMFVAFKTTALLDNWNDLIGNSSAVASGFGLRYSSSGGIQTYLGGTTIGGAEIEPGEICVMAFNYDAADGEATLWDSKSKSTSIEFISPADFSLSSPVTLGSTTNDTRYFRGCLGEVRVYGQSLSEALFQEISDSLFVKWVAASNEKEPPTPNPASFAIHPQPAGSSIITMTASTGSDESGIVMYRFTELSGNPGGTTSDWQVNPNYRDGDLEPETNYTYTVTMRDAYGNEGAPSPPVTATTGPYTEPGLENELEYGAYYGYQGWHFAAGDGRIQSNEWIHWFEGGIPDAEHIHGDMWPDLREYDPANLYATDMVYPDGTVAKLYSCFDYSTIDLHIKWMSEYGIKGCAVQRFTSSIDKANKLEQGDKKVRDVMTACEKYGVKFWIMHDSGQGDEEEYERITNDWKHLVDDLDILQSPAYTWQDGKPVYGLWGMGVSSRSWTPQQAMDLIDFYHHGEDKYQTYICAGVPVNWRTNPPSGWRPVYDSLDMISPWRTIFNNPDNHKSRMQADFAYCNEHGIDYNPVVSPGASTLHLRDSEEMRNWKPRNGGYFLWKQAYEVCQMGSKFMYVAMFDEVDEGTAMYKLVETEDNLPVGARQVPLNEDGYDLPSDWYLQLGTEIQKMIEGTAPVTSEIPLKPKLLSAHPRQLQNGITVYPVPAGNELHISGVERNAEFQLLNLQGVVLRKGQIGQHESLNIQDLSTGIYLLRLDESVCRFFKN